MSEITEEFAYQRLWEQGEYMKELDKVENVRTEVRESADWVYQFWKDKVKAFQDKKRADMKKLIIEVNCNIDIPKHVIDRIQREVNEKLNEIVKDETNEGSEFIIDTKVATGPNRSLMNL